jgi:hypothetical protein
MQKKLSVFAAVILIVFLLLPAYSLADEGRVVRLSVGSAGGEVGTEVDIAILLYDCERVDSVEFDLNYDPAALSVVSVTPGDLFPVEYCFSNASEPGVIHIACACELGLENSGTLLTVRFRILSEAGSALTVTSHLTEKEITYIDNEYNQYAAYVDLENGGVRAGADSVPEPLVTPWTPASPTPEPSPTPAPTEAQAVETLAPQQEAEAEAPGSWSDIDPVAYYVVGGLVGLLAVLITVAVAIKKKNRSKTGDKPNKPKKK